MSVAFVQAGSGVAILTGTGTFSITGTTAGNLLVIHFCSRGTADDWSDTTHTNIETLAGGANDITPIQGGLAVGNPEASKHALFCGRSMAGGTVDASFAVGASGEDIFGRIYEFSGADIGTTVADVFENDAGIWQQIAFTNTSVEDAPVVTNDSDRLACSFVALASNQAIGPFTGESGGDWAEAAEFQSGSGATATLQLQTAAMAAAGTINGGSVAVSSIAWGCVGTAVISAPPPADAGLIFKRFYGPAQLPSSAADLYTVPTGRVARVLGIHFANPSGSSRDINLSIGADAAATRVYDDFPLAADAVERRFDPYDLAAAEKIQGWADSASTVVATISGWEDDA